MLINQPCNLELDIWRSYAMDNIYFDEETGQLMQSVTVPGGDVIQIPYEKEEE